MQVLNDKIQDYAFRIMNCESFDECWQVYLQQLKIYGINDVTYGIVPINADFSDVILHTTFPEEMLNYYVQNNGLNNDYMIHSNVLVNDAFVWIAEEKKRNRWIEHHFKDVIDTRQSDHMVAAWRDFKIENGMCFSFNQKNTGIAGVSLSATDVNSKHFIDQVLPFQADLQLISELFHQFSLRFSRHIALSSNLTLGVSPLTPAEIETVRWLAHGLSLKQIADQKLYRSIESVNLYVRNARTKLKARNRDQLIANAILLGII